MAKMLHLDSALYNIEACKSDLKQFFLRKEITSPAYRPNSRWDFLFPRSPTGEELQEA